MLLPFNEMSLTDIQTPTDIENFFSLIEDLVRLLNLKKLPDVVFGANVLSDKIDGSSSLYEIITNSKLNSENKGILFGIIQNTPFLEEEDLSEIQIKHNNNDAFGLTYAYLKDVPVISIPRHPWLEFLISAQKEFINSNGNMDKEDVVVKNVGLLDQCKETWLAEILPQSYYENSTEFLNYCSERFKSIRISEDSIQSIKSLPLDRLKKMERSFQILNSYCENNWKFGKLRYNAICDLGLHLRPDSEITMQMYGEQRNFKNEDRESESFTLHFDVSEGERAYLKGLTQERNVFIAYVGPHLSTKDFPK